MKGLSAKYDTLKTDEPTDAGQSVCLNCGAELHEGNFCHICGQPTDTRRLTTKNMGVTIISGLTRINGRFLNTFLAVLLKPWTVVSNYIGGKRVRYVAPVQMLIVLVFVNFALTGIFGLQRSGISQHMSGFDFIVGDGVVVGTVNSIVRFLLSSMVMLYILLMLPAIPVVRTFHRWAGIRKYNIAEYIVGAIYMACFILALNIVLMTPEIFLHYIGIECETVQMIVTIALIFIMFSAIFYKSLSSSGKSRWIKGVIVASTIIAMSMAYFLVLLLLVLIHNAGI